MLLALRPCGYIPNSCLVWWLIVAQHVPGSCPFLVSIFPLQRTLYLSSFGSPDSGRLSSGLRSFYCTSGRNGGLASSLSFLSSHEATMTQVCIVWHTMALVLFSSMSFASSKEAKPSLSCDCTAPPQAVTNTDNTSHIPTEHTKSYCGRWWHIAIAWVTLNIRSIVLWLSSLPNHGAVRWGICWHQVKPSFLWGGCILTVTLYNKRGGSCPILLVMALCLNHPPPKHSLLTPSLWE